MTMHIECEEISDTEAAEFSKIATLRPDHFCAFYARTAGEKSARKLFRMLINAISEHEPFEIRISRKENFS